MQSSERDSSERDSPTESPAEESTWRVFDEVVRRRRSVRRFTPDALLDDDVRDIMRAGLLAPTSSNMQPFELYWVRSPDKRAQLVAGCLAQSAARKAQALIVCVARWDLWDDTRREHLAFLERESNVPEFVMLYYRQLSRAAYSLGPLGLWGAARKAGLGALGLFRPVPRFPLDREDMRVWAVKSASLVCENIMLAASAKGLDTCPMEGIDPLRVGELVGLQGSHWKHSWDIPMVLAVGHRDPQGGLWGAQWRRDEDKLIKEI